MSGRFMTPLVYGPERPSLDPRKWDGRKHVLREPLEYETADGRRLTVPGGFSTDGASIPRVFWRVMTPFGSYIEAAALHDFMYGYPASFGVTRKEADDMFREAMEWCGVPAWQRWVMWVAVRIGGAGAYAAGRRWNHSKDEDLA